LLSLFKSNNPFVVVFYIVYLLLFRVCFTFIPFPSIPVFDHREPLSQVLFPFLQSVSTDYSVLSSIVAGVLCFVQALFINQIINSNKILAKKTYVGGLFFIIFSSFLPEGLFLSPASVALSFLIISISKLFSLFRKDKANTDIFDVGFLIAIATMFYFPSILFLILAYIGLATIRPFDYREWLAVLTGFFSPFFILFTYYFWFDITSSLPGDVANFHSTGWLRAIPMSADRWAMIATLLLLSAILLTMLPAALYSRVIQVRKFAGLMAFFIAFTALSFVLQQTISLSHLVLLSLPLAIISAMVISQIKRNLVSEVIHLILILLVLAGQLLPLFNLF
jgi:hypothetical protein